MRILITTSNQGKLRDFAAAAALYGVRLEGLPGFATLPEAVEDGATFEENARKKAEHYSRFAPAQLVLADDSGLSVEALGGEPGVHSARYAAAEKPGDGCGDLAGSAAANMDAPNLDAANNAKLLRELEAVPDAGRAARFVCVLSAARERAPGGALSRRGPRHDSAPGARDDGLRIRPAVLPSGAGQKLCGVDRRGEGRAEPSRRGAAQFPGVGPAGALAVLCSLLGQRAGKHLLGVDGHKLSPAARQHRSLGVAQLGLVVERPAAHPADAAFGFGAFEK